MTVPIDPDIPEMLEYVTLMSAGQAFGIEIRQIREIRRWSPITALPHAPYGVLGVINLRGAVVPILDLAARLGLGVTPNTDRAVFVITRIGTRIAGLLVDSVSEIISIGRAQLREVPAGLDGARCVQGLFEAGQDMIRILDLQALVAELEPAAAA